MAAKLEYGAEREAAESVLYSRMGHRKETESVFHIGIWSRMASESASYGKK